MSKVYIIKSFSFKALQKKIDTLIKSENIIHFDLEEDELSNLLEEANYISLFKEEIIAAKKA